MFKNFLLSTILLLGIFCFTSSFKVSASEKITIDFSDLANILPWTESSCTLNEGGIKLYSCKENISSSERYLDILVKLDTTTTNIKGTKVIASLYSNKDLNKALVKREVLATAPNSVVCIDMRQLNENKACLKVEWKDVRNRLLGTGIVWISSDPITPLPADTKIPFTIDVPNGVVPLTNYPVRFGVPFPEGSVWNTDNLILVDSKGKELPSQFEVAGRWAREGAVKWLLIDSIISGKNGDEIYLVLGKRSSKSLPSTPVVVTKKGNTFDVNTGVAQYIVGVDGALIKEARLNKQLTAKEGKSRGLYVVDQIGRLAKASSKDASVKLEADGPVSAVIRVEGFYVTDNGEELARHITRLEFNSGRPEVSVTHTLVLTQDTNKVWFKEVGWEFETFDTKNVKGLFSVAPENPQDISTIPLGKDQKINIIQTEGINLGLKPTSWYMWNKPETASYRGTPWICYFHGKNSFEVRQTGKEKNVYENIAMSDWVAISGENVGFMVSCRNIGAQHPKEYQLSENLLNLKLFSPSTGKELDFRMPALMKNWGMSPKEKIEGHDKVSEHLLEKYLNFIVKHKSNAVGWSKTHDILLTPFLSTHNIQQTSFLHSKQVYIHNSPKWVRETEVIGPLHPKDTEKFPEEETVIDGIFWGLYKMWSCGPYGGFIDYHAGPNRIVHGYRSGGYSLRADSWYLYARSGERDLREFAQGSNRVFLDGNISHWNFTDKIMGLLIGSAVSPGKKSERNRVIDLPMHWQGGGLRYELSTVADMEQALLDYYFTGYRRAGDILVNFSNAAKNNLTYEEKHDRVILAMRHLTEAYEFTWEPRLRELIYEINNRYLYDPEGMVLLSKTRPYRSTTYKTETDQDSLLLMWSVFKDPLFKKMAISIGQNNWENMSILPRVRTQSQNRATGLLYYFMWKETKNPVFLSDFDYARRRLVADRLVDINTKKVIVPCTSQIPRFFKGLPLAMDMLSQSDAQIETPSSWLAFKVEESPIRIFFVKPGAETLRVDSSAEKNETELNILIRKEGNVSVNQTASKEKKDIPKPSQAGGNIVIKPHISYEGHMWSGHDLHTVIEKSTGVSKAIIPKDAPGGVYELSVNQSGYYSVFSDKHIPIALYAPEGWYPLKMNPPVRTYFNVPKGADKGRIFFEKKTNLFTPNGETYNDGKEVFGWVEIPKNLSGLWGFESVDPGKVKVENIPPFFAIENPKLYNIPLEKKAPPLQKVKGSLDWASKWRVFGPFHQYDPVVPLSVLSSYPEKIKVGEKEVKGVDIEVSDTIYDFPNILKEEQSGSVAYVFLTFNSNKTQNVTLGMGADWWMQVWVNGKLVHDSTKTSNIHFPFSIWNHLVNVRVKKGENLLAVRFVRGGGSQLALGGPDQLRVTPLPSDNNRFVGMSEAEKEFSVFLTGER